MKILHNTFWRLNWSMGLLRAKSTASGESEIQHYTSRTNTHKHILVSPFY